MFEIKILAKKYIFVTILDNLSPNFILLETQIIHKRKNFFTSFIKKTNAFSLVELIIVITILSILSTLWFVSFKNYNNTARDSVRVTDIKTIFEWLSIYKVKSWIYPLPNNPTQISAGNNILTYQGEISKGIKQLISLNGKWTDPKDATNYVYAVDATQQKWQLLWYLENWDNIKTISLFPQIYANLSQRYVYIYWDKLGIITDENNTPIQYTTTNTWVNILDNEYAQKELITYIWWDVWNGWKTTSTWNILAQEIESSLSGTLSCGEKSYNGYILSWLSHNQTWTFIKENSISHGTQNLQLTITCINGEFDTTWATENIVSTTCTSSGYVSYNNTCVENKCQNTIPLHATSTATSQNHQISWSYQETPWECSFKCNLNYTYNSWNNTCDPNTKVETCSSIPSNSSYNSVNTISQTWNGIEWMPSNISTHDVNASMSECRFTCNSWYSYDLGSNSCIWNSCSIPSTESYNSKTYTITNPGILLHNNSVTRSGTTSFWVSPANGSLSADFQYTCNAWVLSKTVSNTGGSCNTGYTFNNNYSTPACWGNSCNTPTSGVHSGLTYTLTSQSLAHVSSVTVTSANRAFGVSPANGSTSAKFTFSCNAWVISLTSTANNAGACNTSGYTFNNNYSSPACTSPCNWQYHAVFGPVWPVSPNPNTTQCTYSNNWTIARETTSPYQKVATCTCN